MLRRKPTRIEMKAEDKDELDEARRSAVAAAAAAPGSSAAQLAEHRPSKPSVAQRIGFSK